MSRQEIYYNIFSARALFIAGLFMMSALLFNPSTEYRVLQFLFFWFLAWLSGKKTRPVFTVLAIIFIVTFNLIIPYGRILFSFGAFKITSGALTAGIHRAVTFAALVMVSKITVRHDLQIPGVFGELLGNSLRMFSAIMDRKFRITGKNLITEIDNLMLELSKEKIPLAPNHEIRTKPAGYIVLITVVILSWLPWFAQN